MLRIISSELTIANKLLQEYLKIGNERILNFKNKTNQIKEKFNNLDTEIKDKLKKELNEKIEDIFRDLKPDFEICEICCRFLNLEDFESSDSGARPESERLICKWCN